jgi:hypothetical protein
MPSRLLVLRFESGHRKEPPLLFHTSRPALGLSHLLQNGNQRLVHRSNIRLTLQHPPQALQSVAEDLGFQFIPLPFRPVSGHCVPAYSQYLQINFSLIPSTSAVGIWFSVFSLYHSKLTAHKVEKVL